MKKIKLRWQIIIAIVIVSFLSVTISIFSVYRISVKTIRKQYIQQSEDKLSALNALVDKELDNLVTIIRKHMLDDDVLNAISTPPAVYGTSYFDTKSKDNIQEQVTDMVTQVSKIQGVFLFDDYGRYFMHLGNGEKAAPYRAYYTTELDKEAAWYRAVENSKGKEIFWNGDVMNPENKNCFSVIKKINDTTKYKPHGIMIVTVSKSFLETLCGDLNFKNMVMLVDGSSELMFGIGDKDQTKTAQLYNSYHTKESSKNQYLFLESKNQTTGWKFVAGIRNDELYSGSKIFETYIYVADVLDKRLDKALELGATRVFNSTRENIEDFVKTLPDGGVDQVYECAGNRITTLQTCRLIKRAGKVTLVGVSPEPVLELDIATLNAMEGTIYSVYRYRNLWTKAIKAVSTGAIPVAKIVSHEFAFDDCIEAIDYSLNHKDEVIKSVIKM